MCFADDPKVEAPQPPPEVLDQAAPEKKTANKKDAGALAIGTKRYRTESGLGITGQKQNTRPAGPSVSM